jgi:hypothetical protein
MEVASDRTSRFYTEYLPVTSRVWGSALLVYLFIVRSCTVMLGPNYEWVKSGPNIFLVRTLIVFGPVFFIHVSVELEDSARFLIGWEMLSCWVDRCSVYWVLILPSCWPVPTLLWPVLCVTTEGCVRVDVILGCDAMWTCVCLYTSV